MLEKEFVQFFKVAKEQQLTSSERVQIVDSVQKFITKTPVRIPDVTRHSSIMKNPLLIGKKTKLASQEKDQVLHMLHAFMEEHPVSGIRHTILSAVRAYFSANQFVTGALAVLLLVGAGTTVSYAAENALPSDFLYFIKVNLNEPIAEALTRTPAKQAAVQMRHLQRRAVEVQILAGKEELDDADTERLEQSITTFMSRIEAKIGEMDRNAPGSEQLIRQYRNVLTMQESALNALQNENITAQRIEQILQQVKSARQRFESSSSQRVVKDEESVRSNTNVRTTTTVTTETQEDTADGRVDSTTSATARVRVESDTDSTSTTSVEVESSVSNTVTNTVETSTSETTRTSSEPDDAASIIDEINEEMREQEESVDAMLREIESQLP